MARIFASQEEFAETVLSTATTLQRALKGSRNDVALSALLITAGAAMERFASQDRPSTPDNVVLLIALLKDVIGDIAEYAVSCQQRES